jgi:hypothetical protein
MNTRKLVASTAAVLTLSVGGLAVAAANPFASAGASTPTTTTAPAATPAKARKAHPRLRHFLKEHRGAIVTTVADTTHTPKATVVADLRKGESITQIAEAAHVPVSTVSAALVKQGDAAVAKALAAGRITSAQAAKLDARIPKAVGRLVVAHKK